MRKPKPPTARSVSATLRAADFHAAVRRGNALAPAGWAEGFRVDGYGTNAVLVYFETDDPDLHAKALWAMRRTLIRKGWKVSAGTESRFLLVTAMEG